jgi:hypothetical protein
MTSDSVVLPLAVAAERSALSEQELLAHPWCQVFKRYLPDREPEIAVVLPNALVGGSARERAEHLRELDAL